MKCLKIILLLILTSCNGITPKHSIDVERCFVSLEKTILVDGVEFHYGSCRCHQYRVGDEIKRLTDSIDKPLMYCDKQAVFKDYASTLYLFLESWRVFLLQQ
jgi:hypothetical protein